MDERLRATISDLRRRGSSGAADWLMEEYPVGNSNSGEALTIILHLSWKKPDQQRLADHFLSGLPFASARPYEAFASFMSVPSLIEVMRKYLPSCDRKQLFEYHVAPVLARAAKTPADREAVETFLAEVRAR
jgi:hypothetical protein